MIQQRSTSTGYLAKLIATAIDKAAYSGDLFTNESIELRAAGKSVTAWKQGVNFKCAVVGFLTGLPGGCIGSLLLGADLTYLFSAAGQGCYGIGYIKGRTIDRERDLQLILAIWCGVAEATAMVPVGKIAIKVGAKAGIQAGAAYAAKVIAKSAVKPAGKGLAKLVPMIFAKASTSLAGKLGATLIPILGGIISALVNYWVANGLMTAAEKYYSSEYVLLDADFDPVEFAEDTVFEQLPREV